MDTPIKGTHMMSVVYVVPLTAYWDSQFTHNNNEQPKVIMFKHRREGTRYFFHSLEICFTPI